MKNIILFFLLILLGSGRALAQNQNGITTTFRANINTSFYDSGKLKMNQFIKKYATIVISQNETTQEYMAEFYLSEQNFKLLDSLLLAIGYIQSKEIKTENNSAKIEKINLELDYLIKRKESFETELKSMKEKEDKYYDFWNEVRLIDSKIFNLQTELKEYKADNVYKATVNIFDETYDLTDAKVTWVNMPGVSFEFISVESPKIDLSAKKYMGYSLKYMFTRGKTYINLGALKEFSDEAQDSVRFKELFMFGFGQDFYSKYFGRGKRKVFNLYTGYNIGGIFATSDSKKRTLMYLTPYFGVELFKNKYFLLDNRIGYIVPFSFNRNLRGIIYNASFNFVF